jgi:hypothetical protein
MLDESMILVSCRSLEYGSLNELDWLGLQAYCFYSGSPFEM